MTRTFPSRVSSVGHYLTQVAGSYLHSVSTGSWSDCGVCALPIDASFVLCPQCQGHRHFGEPLADRTGFLVYADEPLSQTYLTMRGYKEPRTRATFAPIVQALLAVGLGGHFVCANKLAGFSDNAWAVVPSTRGRTTFVDLTRSLARSTALEIDVQLVGPKPERILRPDSWTIAPFATPPNHVVVIDDSWVSGASSQSLAVALKRVGVSQVSIFSIARVLSPRWSPNTVFMRDVLPGLPYDWETCPWTRGMCP